MRKLKVILLSAVLLYSCDKKSTNIEFCFLIDERNKEIESTILSIAIPYSDREKQLMPGYNSKVVVTDNASFKEYKLFHRNKIQEFMNFPLDERKLNIKKEKFNLNTLTANSTTLLEIHESTFLKYLKNKRGKILFKKFNDSLHENTVQFIKKSIQEAIKVEEEIISDHLIVIGLPYIKKSNDKIISKKVIPYTPVQKDKIGTAIVITEKDDLHVRIDQSIKSSILFELPKGNTVDVLKIGKQDIVQGNLGHWVKIRYDNNIGWAWGYYLELNLN